MRNVFCALLLLLLTASATKALAQVPDAAQLERLQKMAEGLKGLTPDQIIKKQDSILKIAKQMQGIRDNTIDTIINQTAAKHPNKDVMLQYDPTEQGDTTYVSVTATYSYTTGVQPQETVTMSGSTQSAAMITRGKITTMYLTNDAPPSMQAYPPGGSKKYKDANTSFKVNGSMHYAAGDINGTSGGWSLTYGSGVDNTKTASFMFTYDQLQHIGSAGFGALFHCKGQEKAALKTTPVDKMVNKGFGGAEGLANGITVAGAPTVKNSAIKDPILFMQTPTGYSISYNKHTVDQGQSTTETFTATIGAPMANWEAVIKPVDADLVAYRKWLPKGPKIQEEADDKPGDSLRFHIMVCDKTDTTKLYNGNYIVKWELVDVTKYPGYCNNYPAYTDNPNVYSDLKFSDMLRTDPAFDGNATDSFKATSKPNKGQNTVVKVLSRDYGAWGKLVATVTLDDGTPPITARAYYGKNTQHLTIPLDEDEDKIADAWEKKYNVFAAGYPTTWDEDKTPDNKHPGDDISMLDEYRGFAVDSDARPAFVRTDPTQKDLFVCRAETGDQYIAMVKGGASLYTKICGITTHVIGNTATTFKCVSSVAGHDNKYPNSINYNSPEQKHHSYAICMHVELQPSEANGGVHDDGSRPEANTVPIVPNPPGAQLPCETDFVNIFLTTVRDVELAPKATWLSPVNPGPGGGKNHLAHAIEDFHYQGVDTPHLSTLVTAHLNDMVTQLCILSIAHEMGHATNIPHHDVGAGHHYNFFSGVSSCPMRYFLSTANVDNATRADCFKNYDRMMAFFSQKWDPTTGLWPEGTPMKFCTTEDNCWSKLQLKQ